jgi:cysteine-rich repeat protein
MSRLWLCLLFCTSCTVFGGFARFVCGDGIVQDFEGEECDDGNTTLGDGCAADCFFEVCGNGRLDIGEACDDGNTLGGDGCRADCAGTEECGDGLLDLFEACDDGNQVDGDGCDSNCTETACGNGVISPQEICLSQERQDVTDSSLVSSIVAADVDNDGDIDLAATQAVENLLLILHNDGAGESFTPSTLPAEETPSQLVANDIDGDGDVDLALLSFGADTISVYPQFGSQFQPAIVLTPPFASISKMRVVDIDGDGLLDIAVSSSENQIAFLRQTSPLQFQTVLINGLPRLVTVNPVILSFNLADWNNDGRADLFVTTNETPGRMRVLFQSEFTPFSFFVEEDISLGEQLAEVKLADIDLDSDSDILVVDRGADTLHIVRNLSGLFGIPEEILAASDTGEFVIADTSSDAFPDLLFVSGFGPELVIQQQGEEGFSLKLFALNFLFFSIAAGDFNSDGVLDVAMFGFQQEPPGDSFVISLFLAEP